MNSMHQKVEIQSLSNSFTKDAMQLLSSYLNSLHKKMDDFNITSEQQSTIFNGITEFILEFIEEYEDKAQVNFNDTLELIQEIGSPSEILQAINIPIEEIIEQKAVTQVEEVKKVTCKRCNWINKPNSNFCENCGINLLEKWKGAQVLDLPQEVVDFPYISSYLLSYLILLILGNLWLFIIGSPINPYSITKEKFFNLLYDIPVLIIVPTIFFGTISGYMINSVYISKKSSKYDKKVAHFQGYHSLGVLMTLMSCWWIYIYIPVHIDSFEGMIILGFLSFIANGLAIMIFKRNLENKSMITSSYLLLLRSTRMIDNHNRKKLKTFNIWTILITVFFCAILWGNITYYAPIFGLPPWITTVSAIMVFLNGIALMNLYSWANINQLIVTTHPRSE